MKALAGLARAGYIALVFIIMKLAAVYRDRRASRVPLASATQNNSSFHQARLKNNIESRPANSYCARGEINAPPCTLRIFKLGILS